MDFFKELHRITEAYRADNGLPQLFKRESLPCHFCGEDAYDGKCIPVSKDEFADVCQACLDGYDEHSDDLYNSPTHDL